jgi:hypothetical protein
MRYARLSKLCDGRRPFSILYDPSKYNIYNIKIIIIEIRFANKNVPYSCLYNAHYVLLFKIRKIDVHLLLR